MDNVSDEAFAVYLRQVQAIDPGCSPEAVRRFMQEIVEADAALELVNLDEGVTLPVAYSPSWTKGSGE